MVQEFNDFRSRMNARILSAGSTVMKRVYSLDTLTYQPGALGVKTKELAGLCASMVLRCDDCVRYHIQSSLEAGATEQEIVEIFDVALVVGGTIVVPHLRRAFAFMDELLGREAVAE